MAHLYTVMVTANPGIGIEDVQAALTPAVSWYRIAPNSWVIATWETSDVWWRRLRHLVHPNGRLFICRLAPTDREGWMDQPFWDWVNVNASFR